MSTTAKIREATVGDVARIGMIARTAYAKYVSRIGREPAPMAADYGAEIAAHRVVVMEVDGTVGGYMVSWPEADAYFIETIAVDPDYQGGGLGRQLIEYAAAQARRLQLPVLRLYTNTAMTENLSMYAHFGFAETHRAIENGYNRVYLRWTLSDQPCEPPTGAIVL